MFHERDPTRSDNHLQSRASERVRLLEWHLKGHLVLLQVWKLLFMSEQFLKNASYSSGEMRQKAAALEATNEWSEQSNYAAQLELCTAFMLLLHWIQSNLTHDKTISQDYICRRHPWLHVKNICTWEGVVLFLHVVTVLQQFCAHLQKNTLLSSLNFTAPHLWWELLYFLHRHAKTFGHRCWSVTFLIISCIFFHTALLNTSECFDYFLRLKGLCGVFDHWRCCRAMFQSPRRT